MNQTFSLSPTFSLVELEAKRSFAHNVGDMTTVTRVTIAGEPCEQSEILAGVVAHWGGWSAAGGRDDEDVRRTALEFALAWAGVVGGEVLQGDGPPEELVEAAERRDFPAWHPPRATLHALKDGTRLVACAWFERGEVGMRGQRWNYEARAWRVSDGAAVRLPAGERGVPPLPTPATFAERDSGSSRSLP